MDDYISPYEAEHLVQTLKQIDIREYGSKQWFQQHETIDRLNIQAHKNAQNSTDEFVMEFLVTYDKMNTLIYDLLTCEAWKQKIYPQILPQLAKISSIRSYLTIYHEATITNLLEVVLYHRTATENSQDALVELIDYCYRKFINLTKWAEVQEKKGFKKDDPKAFLNISQEQELQRQFDELEFNCAISSISLIRFISDHMDYLPVPVVHQMMENNDIPCVLVPLLELKPWLRKNGRGDTEKFEDQKWVVVPESESLRVTKIEAQIWLTIYNMFLSQESNRKYEITTFRKGNLLRLRKYLNEVLIDQMPMLSSLLRGLEELQLMQDNPVQSKNSFIVQQIPELRTKIMRDRDWKDIAMYQITHFFKKESDQEMKEEMDKIMKLYNSEVFDTFLEDPKCANCGKPATQRCSRCKNQWYCSRDCQIREWKGHKPLCDIIFQNKKDDAERDAEAKKDQQEKREQDPKQKVLIQEIGK